MAKNDHDVQVLTADVITGLLTGLAIAIAAGTSQGCTQTTGWSVNFGVTPISKVNERRTLGEVEQAPEEIKEGKKTIW